MARTGRAVAPPASARRERRGGSGRGQRLGFAALVVLLVAGLGGLAYAALGRDDDSSPTNGAKVEVRGAEVTRTTLRPTTSSSSTTTRPRPRRRPPRPRPSRPPRRAQAVTAARDGARHGTPGDRPTGDRAASRPRNHLRRNRRPCPPPSRRRHRPRPPTTIPEPPPATLNVSRSAPTGRRTQRHMTDTRGRRCAPWGHRAPSRAGTRRPSRARRRIRGRGRAWDRRCARAGGAGTVGWRPGSAGTTRVSSSVAQLAVAVRRDAVASVAVVVERERAERDAVARGESGAHAGRGRGGGAGRVARPGGWRYDRRGSSTMRSYMNRRPHCHGTVSTTTSSTVSAPSR